MMKFLCKVLLIASLGTVAHAEMRDWTLKSGDVLDGEYVATQMNKVVLKRPDGSVERIPIENFNDEDLKFIALENPPDLKVEFFQSSRREEPKPSPIWPNNSPVSVFYHTFGARVKQKSAGEYKYPLTLEVYAISHQVLDGDKYHLLYRKESEAFTLSRENGREFEFRDDEEIRMVRYVMDVNLRYARGEKFAESMVLVRDERGKVIAHKASRSWLFDNREKMGDLPVGAWFNDKCIRVHPTSPKEPWPM